MDHLDDVPPFALPDTHPQHLFIGDNLPGQQQSVTVFSSISEKPSKSSMRKCVGAMGSSHASSQPGLVSSFITDGSSSRESDSFEIQNQRQSYLLGESSNFLLSSLPTITSTTGSSLYLPHSHQSLKHFETSTPRNDIAVKPQSSGTFSQLMRAAGGGGDSQLHQSRMPATPEDDDEEGEEEDSCAPAGALISAAPRMAQLNNGNRSGWLPNVLPAASRRLGLHEALLDRSVPADEPYLAASPSPTSLDRARTTVKAILEDDQTFEVVMDIPAPYTIRNVMAIIGNPDLLWMWCDPIQSLVVTSTSDGCGVASSDGREYEGEWIEATTSALASPPSHVGTIYSAGQMVFDALGCASYGRVTMFVERRRGQVGLTIGPFRGGIHATHTISVTEADGRVRIMDRVQLRRDTEGATMASLFLCGVLDSCLLSACLMPSLKSYVDQVSTSMARLRILVESGELSPEVEIVGGMY